MHNGWFCKGDGDRAFHGCHKSQRTPGAVYLSQSLARRAAHAERTKLVHMGTCFGKFTKSLKFRLHITCLDYLAQFAKYKVWVKPSSELSYLYGNNVLKAGLGRITENTPQYQGVVVYSMADVPLGFGVTAR